MNDRLPYEWLEREARENGEEMFKGNVYAINEASEHLSRLMETLEVPASDSESPSDDYYFKRATLGAAAIGQRHARAAKVLIVTGYAPEALMQIRTLNEAVDAIRYFTETNEVDRARKWVDGQWGNFTKVAGKSGKLAGDNIDRGKLYQRFSQRTHATSHASHMYYGELDDTGRLPVTVVPEHRQELSQSLLWAICLKLLELYEVIRPVWGVTDRPEDYKRFVKERFIDSGRYTPVWDLLDIPSPYEALEAPTNSGETTQ